MTSVSGMKLFGFIDLGNLCIEVYRSERLLGLVAFVNFRVSWRNGNYRNTVQRAISGRRGSASTGLALTDTT